MTWIEGSALAMPLPDASFDVVLCQQGFQFLPDRAAGLQEVKRVLVPGGRVLLSIWEGETPYSSAMAAAVEKHVGLEPATTLRTSRTCPDPEAVRSLMMQTGFRDARTCARSHALCYGISRPPQWPARLLRSAKENEWPWPTTCARDYWRTRTEMESAIEKSPTS